MPKWFSDTEKELIQKRLLEQGYKLFSAYGLKKTNVDELARAAGISKGAFYRFYESKETLFMDVIEQVEREMRQQLIAMIDLPGPTPRARLYAVLRKGFDIFETVPILKFFTNADFDLLFSRVPAEKVREHLAADQVFLLELVERCRSAGIPIRAPTEQMFGMLYPLVLAKFDEEAFGKDLLKNSIDALLELVAAYCVGEIELSIDDLSTLAPGRSIPVDAQGPQEKRQNESAD
jgi:AcrR family transcriptional regulator